MVSACLAWPGLHIAFAEPSKQPQMHSDSWHACLLGVNGSPHPHTQPCQTLCERAFKEPAVKDQPATVH